MTLLPFPGPAPHLTATVKEDLFSCYACLQRCHAVQLLLIDRGHLHVWDLASDRFIARKCISQQPLLAIFKSSGRGEFGVVTATAVNIWRVEQDLDYRIVLGGHTGPVIAVHAVNGASVRCSNTCHPQFVVSACKLAAWPSDRCESCIIPSTASACLGTQAL